MRPAICTLVLATLLAGCTSIGPAPAVDPAVPQPSAATTPSSAGASASPSARPAAAPATAARAVYYLHDGGRGPRLYREFHPRSTTKAVIADAVRAMLTVRAYDKDYLSLWPAGTAVRGTRVEQTAEGSVAYVDLSREALAGSAGAEGEAQSLQQLVHTVSAAAPSVRSVQLLIEGKIRPTLWGHVSTSRPIARRPAAEVLGPVWLAVPRVLKRGGRFGGEASVFEATVSWEFVQGGRVVKRGFSNASTGAPGRGQWSATADVAPGDYLLRAFESSAKDGSPTFVDDKPVTVTG